MADLSLFSLEGKIALITGSNGGLGRVIAEGLARAGAKVILNGRNEEKLAAAVADFKKKGYDCCGYAFDVTKSEQINKALEIMEKKEGPLDILVNNAGIHDRMPLEDMSDEAWQKVIETDLSSAFYVTRPVVKRMKQRKEGKIINICSLMSEVHRPTIANYSAAKGGLKMLTRALAVEFAPFNIQANGIGPGYFHTELTDSLVKDPIFNEWICKRTPAGRWGDPQELQGLAVFLASQASSYVNGQVIYVDGGILAGI